MIKNKFVFQISFKGCSKNGPRTGDNVKLSVFVLTWMHLGHQRLPMELPGDVQEHLCMILTRFGNNLGSPLAKNKNQMQKDFQTKCPRNRLQEQRTTTPSTPMQVGTNLRKYNNETRARWRVWAKPSGYYYVRKHLL